MLHNVQRFACCYLMLSLCSLRPLFGTREIGFLRVLDEINLRFLSNNFLGKITKKLPRLVCQTARNAASITDKRDSLRERGLSAWSFCCKTRVMPFEHNCTNGIPCESASSFVLHTADVWLQYTRRLKGPILIREAKRAHRFNTLNTTRCRNPILVVFETEDCETRFRHLIFEIL
jgi:hypothetical protein